MVLNNVELFLHCYSAVILITCSTSCTFWLMLSCRLSVAFGYADDIALLVPSLQCLKQMISISEKYASSHSITFNPNKSKLLCYNADLTANMPQVYLHVE